MDHEHEAVEKFWARAKRFAKFKRLRSKEMEEDFVSFAVCDFIKTKRSNLEWHYADFMRYWFGENGNKTAVSLLGETSKKEWDQPDRSTETLIDLRDPVYQKWNAREDWSEDAS